MLRVIVLSIGTILFLTGCSTSLVGDAVIMKNAQEYCKLKGGIGSLDHYFCYCNDNSYVTINYLDHL